MAVPWVVITHPWVCMKCHRRWRAEPWKGKCPSHDPPLKVWDQSDLTRFRHVADKETDVSKFILTTTADRQLEVEAGEPITALAHGEQIARIGRAGHDDPLSDAEVAWVRSHVAPLMKSWG